VGEEENHGVDPTKKANKIESQHQNDRNILTIELPHALAAAVTNAFQSLIIILGPIDAGPGSNKVELAANAACAPPKSTIFEARTSQPTSKAHQARWRALPTTSTSVSETQGVHEGVCFANSVVEVFPCLPPESLITRMADFSMRATNKTPSASSQVS
jgi:hypothetical protein